MRRVMKLVALTGLWLRGVAALAQAPAPVPPIAPVATPAVAPAVAPVAVAPAKPRPPVTAALVQHLKEWEKVMGGAKNFYAKGTYTIEAKAQKSREDSVCTVMCMKPGKARMRREGIPPRGKPANPFDFDAYICTGDVIHTYNGRTKTVEELRLPPGNNGTGQNLMLDFVAGNLTAQGLIDRFDVTLEGEDANYVVIVLSPTLPQDLQEFNKLKLCLYKNVPNLPAYLPRVIAFEKEKGQVVETYQFEQPLVNSPQIVVGHFAPELPPAGFTKTVKVVPPAGAQPFNPAAGLAPLPAGVGGNPAVVPTPGGPAPSTLPPKG